MEFLPKELEDIIIDYKEQIEREEHKERFNKTLSNIRMIKYRALCLNDRNESYIFDIDFPIILRQLIVHNDLKTFITNMIQSKYNYEVSYF